MSIHPIEIESYRILESRVDLSHLEPGPRAVVARVVHATADLDFAHTMRIDPAAVAAGVEALRRRAPVIADVEMVRAGLTGVDAHCYLAETGPAAPGDTRSAAAMRLAAARHPRGALVVVGCAPTALVEAVELTKAGAFAPALIIGLPVGFVGAAEAKDLAHDADVPTITNVGEKGGSAVAAGACNALMRLAAEEAHGGARR